MKQVKLLILLCLSYSLTFAQSFEGTVKLHIEGTMINVETISVDGEPDAVFRDKEEINQDVTFQIKGNMTHFTFHEDGAKMTFITDKSTGDVIQVIEEDGERVVMNLNFTKMIEAEKDEVPDNKVISVTKTGVSKNIRGYFCEEYDVKFEKGNSSVWATTEIQLNMDEQLPLPSDDGLLALSFDEIDGFIIEMNSDDGDGNKLLWEATVERTKIDDSVFEVQLNEEEQKRLDKQEMMKKLLEEYSQKVKEAEGDQEKIKQLTEELTKKIKEFQQ